MDHSINTIQVPLCVDLDGTLVATDTLWEGAISILLWNPLMVFPMAVWLFKGKAELKHQVAKRSKRLAQDWPYRDGVIARLKAETESGRSLILVTGAAAPVAIAVVKHLGIFHEALHSSRDNDLTSHRKRDLLVERFGAGGFDYIGNNKDDIDVFDAARTAIVVAPDRHALKWQTDHGAELIDTGSSNDWVSLKTIRMHQWAKNVLIAVPMVLNHDIANWDLVLRTVIAFFSFSFLASSVYIINDLSDLQNDRVHPKKYMRPLASGQLSIPRALAIALGLTVCSILLSTLLPTKFMLVLGFYGLSTTAYTFILKRKLLVDVFTLAGLYTVRIIAGSVATGAELSFWLLAFSIFFFLSLALVKRYVELNEFGLNEAGNVPGRGYMAVDFEMVGQAGVASAFTASLVLALYIHSTEMQAMYTVPWALWPLCPLVLYLLLRIWMLARRSMLHEDPVVFIMRDWRSQLTMATGMVLVFIGTL